MLETINIGLGEVANLGEFPDPFNSGGFPGYPGERPDRSIEVGLGMVAGSVDFPAFTTWGGRAVHSFDFMADSPNHEVLGDRRGDRLTTLTIPGRRTPIHPVPGPVVRGNNHAGTADTAAENAEPGKEPVGLRFAAPGNRDLLNGLPCDPVHDRLVGFEVDEVPEVKLTEHDAGLQEAAHAVVGPVDAMTSQELPHLSDRGPVAAHFEGLPGDRSKLVGDQHPVLALGVAGNVHVPGGDPSGDGAGLTFGHSALHLPSLIFGNQAEEPGMEPFPIGGAGDFPSVDSEDTTPGFFDAFKDFRLHLQRSEQPIEVSNNKHVRIPFFDALERGRKAGTVRECRPSGHIEFLVNNTQGCVLGFAPLGNPVGLLGWADEPVTFTAFDTGNTDESYGSQGVLKYPTCSPRVLLDTSRKPAFYGAYRPEIRGLMSPSTIWETQLKSEIPGIGDHVTNRKVQGGRYRVHEVTADHLVVRDVMTAVPALIDRSDLDRWRIVWKCERGHEGLTPDPPGLVRVDRALASGGRG